MPDMIAYKNIEKKSYRNLILNKVYLRYNECYFEIDIKDLKINYIKTVTASDTNKNIRFYYIPETYTLRIPFEPVRDCNYEICITYSTTEKYKKEVNNADRFSYEEEWERLICGYSRNWKIEDYPEYDDLSDPRVRD